MIANQVNQTLRVANLPFECDAVKVKKFLERKLGMPVHKLELLTAEDGKSDMALVDIPVYTSEIGCLLAEKLSGTNYFHSKLIATLHNPNEDGMAEQSDESSNKDDDDSSKSDNAEDNIEETIQPHEMRKGPSAMLNQYSNSEVNKENYTLVLNALEKIRKVFESPEISSLLKAANDRRELENGEDNQNSQNAEESSEDENQNTEDILKMLSLFQKMKKPKKNGTKVAKKSKKRVN